jgi:hypothetical protein
MTYKVGYFKCENPQKYIGDSHNIVWRSSWERKVFKFLDMNSKVVKWNSEQLVIPYICETDNKPHRYFVDIIFETDEGKIYVIEIKPAKECSPPRKCKDKVRYLKECATFIKNQSKWKYAEKYCASKGWIFKVWTEHELAKLGIKL